MSNIFKINKKSGTGPDQLEISTLHSTYLGREPKYGTLRVTGDNYARVSTVSLKLKGAKEFITFSTDRVIADSEKLAVISGTSNTKNLILAGGSLTVVSTKINGSDVTNYWNATSLTAIPDDPGATDAYTFEVTVRLSGDSSNAMFSSGTGVAKNIVVYASSSDVTNESIVLGNYSRGNSTTKNASAGTLPITANVPWYINTEKLSWLNVSPLNGPATSILSVTVPENTGRARREAIIEALKLNDSTGKVKDSRTISQDGADIFIKLQNENQPIQIGIDDVDDDNNLLIIIKGKTNGYRFENLTFTQLVGMSVDFVSLKAGTESYSSEDSFPITLDSGYGESQAYDFVIRAKINMEAGATSGTGSFTLRVGPGSTAVATGSIEVLASGQEFLNVMPLDGNEDNVLTIPASGVSEEISISTNVGWEIISNA